MPDLTQKKINLATNSVFYATQLVDAVNSLRELANERTNLSTPFQDSDFVGTQNSHLTAQIIGTLFDFVVPSYETNYTDQANGGRNENILLQMRK